MMGTFQLSVPEDAANELITFFWGGTLYVDTYPTGGDLYYSRSSNPTDYMPFPIGVSGVAVGAGSLGLYFRPDPDFEGDAGSAVTRVENYGPTSYDEFLFSVTPIEDTPRAVTLSNDTVPENQAGAGVGVLGTDDPDLGDYHTYTLIGDVSGKFEISAGTLRLKTGESVDYEMQSSYTVRVRSIDSTNRAVEQNLTVNVVNDANESFEGTASADELTGTDDDDDLSGMDGDDIILGSAGNDHIDGGADNDFLFGGEDDDTLIGGPGDDLLAGGPGTDTADYSNAPGGVKVRLMLAGPQNTLSSGNDTLNSIENIIGSSFDDILRGDDNANTIIGGSGMDELRGAQGSDMLMGDAGDDTIIGGGGIDIGYGGADNDTIRTEIAWGDGGNDNIRLATEGHGGDGEDDLRGALGESAMLFGDADNDSLLGGTMNDTLDGGTGDDFLRGAEGKDIATGGTGADTFRFNEGDIFSNTTNTDRITDYNEAEGDRINLVSIDAIVGGGDDSFSFIGNATFSSTAGELRWEQDATDTYLMGDTTGDGFENFMIKLDGLVAISGAGLVL